MINPVFPINLTYSLPKKVFAIILNSFNNTYVPSYFVLLVPNNFVLPPIHFYLQIIKTQSVLALNTSTALSLHKPTFIKK